MGRHLRLLAFFCLAALIVFSLASCFSPDNGTGTEVPVSEVGTTTVTTTEPIPEENPPPMDSGYDDDGFENRPEDDETKRY